MHGTLITIFIFLAALRNRIIEINPDYERKDEINKLYLIKKYHPEDKYKVIPTQADRNIFFTILNEVNPVVGNNHLIAETYKFFKNEKLSKINDLNYLVSLKDTLLSKFSVVDIRLENDDDPYLIFESLNATGTPFTQADLVRNYLFMRINQNNQQDVYDTIWFPMQQNLQDKLENFIRHLQIIHLILFWLTSLPFEVYNSSYTLDLSPIFHISTIEDIYG